MKLSIVDVVVTIVLIVALIPIIVIFSAGTQQCLTDAYPYQLEPDTVCCNTSSWINSTDSENATATNSLSTTERTMLSLVTLFIVLAFIFNIVKMSGLTKKK